MSSELWGVSTGTDLNCLLAASHKRVGCNSSFCVPEAKRQQLSSLFDCDLPALEEDDKKDSGVGMLSATNLMPNPVVGPCVPSALNEEQANIANSSHYIDSLLDIIGAADDFNESVRDLPDVNSDHIEEDDDEMLSNLPTSVDDFQAKEFSLKLERNSTGSPLVSCRQSPIGVGAQLDVSNSSAASECGLITSRTHSVSSNPQIVGDLLDADDLEVAMINESFEEQQKQSKIYGGVNLKSLFYGMPQECDDSQLDEIIFNANEHKTSNASKVVTLSDSDSGAEQDDEDFEEEDADNFTPPINITSNEFIPLLTPKSREFIHRRKSSLEKAPSKAIDIPSASKSSSIKTSNASINQLEDDDEKSRRLDLELEKMMLEGEDDLYPPSFEEEAQFTTPIFSQEPSEQPDNSECAAKAVAYGVVASLFNSPMDQEEILVGDQSKVSEEEKILLSESLLKDMDADDSFLEAEDDSFGGLLSEKCAANETTPDTSGHYSADGCDLLKVPCKKGSNCSSLYADDSSGHSSSATISSSGNCSNDEQKVPVVDSWEELEDSVVAVNMMNEVKNAFELARMGKQDNLLGSSMSEEVYEQHNELNSLTHVLEASTNFPKTEVEMSELIQILGFGEHTWAKKVDDRHYLLVFPSPAKASEALFSNSKRNNGVKLQLLFDASEQSRSRAIKWKGTLKAKLTGPRPQTTASVARRMIANSLNMRIDVSSQQRNKETNQIAAAKEQKLRKNAIWGEND